MNAIVPATAGAGSGMIPTDMGAAMRLAEMMSTGRLVPAHLQKSPGDYSHAWSNWRCVFACRLSLSPNAPASFRASSCSRASWWRRPSIRPVLEDRLAYDFSGVNDTRAVTVRGTMRGEAEPREMTVTLREAQTTNPLWKKQPDQQLCYFGTRAWARRHAPEVMLGVYSPEEFPAADIPVRDTFRGTTLDAEPHEHAAPRDRKLPTAPVEAKQAEQPKRPTQGQWLDALALELAACEGADEVDAILARQDVQAAQDKLRNGARDRLVDMIQVAIERTSPDETSAPNAGVFADSDSDPFRELAPTP